MTHLINWIIGAVGFAVFEGLLVAAVGACLFLLWWLDEWVNRGNSHSDSQTDNDR